MKTFRVDLDIFRGPLDLLLYLVRRHEIEITEIPIAPITEQFLNYLEVLEHLDVNAVGEFLDMASHLIEIKSRMVLPRGGEEQEEVDDPRHELVRRLLEYKKFKDAASMLEERGRDWQQRFARLANDVPPRRVDPADEPIQEVELWDLVSAFGRVMREGPTAKPTSIVYDETPIHVYMQRIHEQLVHEGRVAFSSLFQSGMHKSRQVGIFLAVLELVRHHGIRTEQNELFQEIWVLPAAEEAEPAEFTPVDDYEHGPAKAPPPEAPVATSAEPIERAAEEVAEKEPAEDSGEAATDEHG